MWNSFSSVYLAIEENRAACGSLPGAVVMFNTLYIQTGLWTSDWFLVQIKYKYGGGGKRGFAVVRVGNNTTINK